MSAELRRRIAQRPAMDAYVAQRLAQFRAESAANAAALAAIARAAEDTKPASEQHHIEEEVDIVSLLIVAIGVLGLIFTVAFA